MSAEDKGSVATGVANPSKRLVKGQASQQSAVLRDAVNISSLPESILLHIFSYLEGVTDRCSVARTCHSWNRIIRDAVLWKDHHFQETKLDHRTMKAILLAGLAGLLIDVDLSVTSGDYCPFLYKPKLWNSLTHLERLRVGGIDLCYFHFGVLPASLKSLTIYTMNHFEPKFPATIQCSQQVLPNLEHLEIEDCQDVFANDKIEELRGLHLLLSSSRLNTVILKLMHYVFTKQSLAKISERLNSVTHVCLHSNSVCDDSFKAFVSPLKSVRDLNLQFTNIEADMEGMIRVISQLKTLRKIYLSMFWELRPENIKTMVLSLPELNLVQIYRCRRIKNVDLSQIEKLRDGIKCQFPRYMTLSYW